MKKDKITKLLISLVIFGTATAALIIFWNHNKQYFMRDTSFDDIINKIKQDQIENHTIPNTISVIGPNSSSAYEDEIKTYVSSIGDNENKSVEPDDLDTGEETLFSDKTIALDVQGYTENEEGNSVLVTLYNKTSQTVVVELADITINKEPVDSWLYVVLPEKESRNASIPIGTSTLSQDNIITRLKVTIVGETEYETKEIMIQ